MRGLLVLVELVVQVTHERFEEVLDRQEARHPAVLVDHHGDGAVALAHVGQRLEHAQRLGQQVGLAHFARDLERARIGGVAPLLIRWRRAVARHRCGRCR